MLWLVIIIATLIIEIVTMGLFFLFVAISALIAYIAMLLGANIFIQILIFIAISGISIAFLRPIAVRYFNRGKQKSSKSRFLGKDAIVLTEINIMKNTGLVSIGEYEWAAVSADGKIYHVGDVVRVVKVMDDHVIVNGSK